MKSSISHKVVMAVAFVSLLSGVSQAFAARHDVHRGYHGRAWHGYHRGYAQPVYVPPPAYYAPPPSPGISLFFPLDLRR